MCSWGRHNGQKRTTRSWEITRSATAGPTAAAPRRGDQRSPEGSLQGKEGVLRPFGLLAGAGGGSGRLSRVRPRGRRDGVDDLCPFLKELIELCQIHTLAVECETAGAFRTTEGRNLRRDRTLPSLVTPSSEPSPFWKAQKKKKKHCKVNGLARTLKTR